MAIDPDKPNAFLSYTRFDDEYFAGGISWLREALEKAVQAHTGYPFQIFQDVEDIQPGDRWSRKLDQALKGAQLFIPILTPSFFQSDFCRREARAFLEYETRADRDDLILPIYLIKASVMEDPARRINDDVVRSLQERQHDDWRSLSVDLQHPNTRHRVAAKLNELADAIARAAERNVQDELVKSEDLEVLSVTKPTEPDAETKLEKELESAKSELVRVERERIEEVTKLTRDLEQERISREAEESEEARTLEAKLQEASKERDAAKEEVDRIRNEMGAQVKHLRTESSKEVSTLRSDLEKAQSKSEESIRKHDQLLAEKRRLEKEVAEGKKAKARLTEVEAEKVRLEKERRTGSKAMTTPLATVHQKSNRTPLLFGGALIVILIMGVMFFQSGSEEDSLRTQLQNTREQLSAAQRKIESQTAEARDSEASLQVRRPRVRGTPAVALNESSSQDKEAISTTQQSSDKSLNSTSLASRLERFNKSLNEEGKAASPSFQIRPIRRAGETFRDCPDCPEMAVIPAGKFTMGSPVSERGREDDEGPQRLVTIGKPFALCKKEVTFAEWDACVAAGGCALGVDDAGWGRGVRPVINVTWNNAKQYVQWLAKRTGAAYRLPSEAEWEYAARANTTTPFWTGRTISTSQANFNGASSGGDQKGEIDSGVMLAGIVYESAEENPYRKKTTPTGIFPQNPFGLYDVHGNVWEWVEDRYRDSYQSARSNGRAVISSQFSLGGSQAYPANPISNVAIKVLSEARRVLRGGSWYSTAMYVRSASRLAREQDFKGSSIGFRCARDLE